MEKKDSRDLLRQTGQKLTDAAKSAANSQTAKKVAAATKSAAQTVQKKATEAMQSETGQKVAKATKMAAQTVQKKASEAMQSATAQKVVAGAKAAGKAVADSAVGQKAAELAQAAADSAAGQAVQKAVQKNRKATIILSLVLMGLIIMFVAIGASNGPRSKYKLTVPASWRGANYRIGAEWVPLAQRDTFISYATTSDFMSPDMTVLELSWLPYRDVVQHTEEMAASGELVEAPVKVKGAKGTWMPRDKRGIDEASHSGIWVQVVASDAVEYMVDGTPALVYSFLETMSV